MTSNKAPQIDTQSQEKSVDDDQLTHIEVSRGSNLKKYLCFIMSF
jgi:hypothetical protein